MTTDQKIDEVLKIVREERERNDVRFGQIDKRFEQIDLRFGQIDGRFELSDTRFGQLESNHNQLLNMMIEERALNNARFSQLATGLTDVRKEIIGVKVDLNAKIDKVYNSLSQDIQIFGDDLHQVKRRVTRLEKKFAS